MNDGNELGDIEGEISSPSASLSLSSSNGSPMENRRPPRKRKHPGDGLDRQHQSKGDADSSQAQNVNDGDAEHDDDDDEDDDEEDGGIDNSGEDSEDEYVYQTVNEETEKEESAGSDASDVSEGLEGLEVPQRRGSKRRRLHYEKGEIAYKSHYSKGLIQEQNPGNISEKGDGIRGQIKVVEEVKEIKGVIEGILESDDDWLIAERCDDLCGGNTEESTFTALISLSSERRQIVSVQSHDYSLPQRCLEHQM